MRKTILLIIVLVVCARIVCGQEQTLNIDWQTPKIQGAGKNYLVVLSRPILITGVQINVSMLPGGVGVSDVLAIVGYLPYMMAFGPAPACYPPALHSADYSDPIPYGPVAANGGMGNTGFLASMILKSANGHESERTICRHGMNVYVPSGGILFCHMDQSGSVSADAEMQGVINYIPQ